MKGLKAMSRKSAGHAAPRGLCRKEQRTQCVTERDFLTLCRGCDMGTIKFNSKHAI